MHPEDQVEPGAEAGAPAESSAQQQDPNGAAEGGPSPAVEDADWLSHFYLETFLHLVRADNTVERREKVWIKRFFEHQPGKPFSGQLDVLMERVDPDPEHIDALVRRAARELSEGDKRRFVYNLAQMCKSKGRMEDAEYNTVLEIAGGLGLCDTDADSIINSVFSINDTFMAIIGLLALGFILYTTQSVIVPLVIAVFITMIISRVEGLVARAVTWRWARGLNKLLAMVVILSVISGLFLAATVSGKDIAQRIPYYQEKLTSAAAQVQAFAAARGVPWPEEIDLLAQLSKLPLGETLSSLFSSVFNILGNLVLIIIFVGFLVFSGMPNQGILAEMNEKISGYISIKATISMITGLGVLLICLGFGVDFALFWAIFSFLLNFIPSVGSIIATIPPILLAAIQLDSWATVLVFGLCLGGLQMLLGNVIEPKLMGNKLAVKPLAILLGLIFWGFLWGLPGMFLAAPLMALLRILSSYFNFSRDFERLLAADQ